MNCERAQDWILAVALPGELARAPREIAEHIRQCDSCQRLIERVVRLEESWRQQAVPASAVQAQSVFLQRLADPPSPIIRKPELPRRSIRLARWIVAACVLAIIGVSIGIGVLSTSSQARAESDVIDRMIDWNLQMSEAPTLEERQRLFAERADEFKTDVNKADLSEADRAFADYLMQTGAWLASNDEPVEEADKLNTLADQIVTRAQTSGKPMDEKKTQRFVQQYQKVAQNIEAKVEKAEAKATANPAATSAEHAKKIEKIEARENKRLETLAKLQEKMPEASKKEIKAMLEQEHKKHKPKPGPKHPKGKG
ncbi:MAG TPA: hypothetical protein VGZ47_00120 [Gemmataceae bacterium]|jgi:uncharacterized protein YdiU (UPF0061 family)|nr:hypothetical protein [Gemmataceae bacterium]